MKRDLNILVVEDDEDDFYLLSERLKQSSRWKMTLTHASNYEEGLEKFKSGTFDLCFLDNYLGAHTGIGFLIAINQFENCTPIILLTGIDDKTLDEMAIEAGAADYIPKHNLSKETLARSIRHSLERHKQSELLKKEREKYRILFQSSLEAIFLTDENFEIVEMNQSFKRFLRIYEDSPISLTQLIVDKKKIGELKELSDEASIGSLRKIRINDLQGQEYIVNISLSIIKLSDIDDPIRYQGVIHDVTDIEEAQLKMVETEKFNLTGRMARIIGHEVRNPLTNIILATGELKESYDNLKEEDLELFEMIQRNTERIERLTDELLNSTKMLELNIFPTLVETCIQNAIDECLDRISLKKIKLVKPNLKTSTFLNLDADKFEIALTNIILNATEAMVHTPDPVLEIGLLEMKKAVIITVSDNGRGMSQETIEKIYDPFYSARSGGMGLGMTNVKNILIQHNALLSVESEEHVGTTFKIKVPR